jgi:peroxiredoxin/uncharacterized membrane protein YphA (DoxX/SURF4 family)
MDGAALVVRLLLAAVFAAAAAGKLFDRDGARTAARGFGVPDALSGLATFVLIIAEIAAAALLIPATTAEIGAALAIALLVVLTTVVMIALARGQKPDCHCFGALHSRPVGASTIVRNVVLAAGAAYVLAEGSGPTIASWWRSLSSAGHADAVIAAVLGLAVLIEGVVAWRLFLGYGRLLMRVDELETASAAASGAPARHPSGHGLAIGTPAPEFALEGLYGETLTLASLTSLARPVVLVFTDPHCGPCGALTPELAAWQQALAGRVTLAVVSRGAPADNATKFATAGLHSVVVQHDAEVSDAYLVPGTPSAVIVGADGAVASGVAAGADAIRRLVADVSGSPSVPVAMGPLNGNGNGNGAHHEHAHAPQPAPAPVLEPGAPAPDFDLPDLDGDRVTLASRRGRELLLVWWNPGCGFCTQLLPELREWSDQRGAGDLEPLVITTGSVEENRALGLDATMVLDAGFSVGPRYGAFGTPSAIVVGPDGRIASQLAVGGPAVMQLAARTPG